MKGLSFTTLEEAEDALACALDYGFDVLLGETIVLSKRFSERRRTLLARVGTSQSASVQSAGAAFATICGCRRGYLDRAG